MSNQTLSDIAHKHNMIETCILGHATQRECDEMAQDLLDDSYVKDNFIIKQFASGLYYVVLVPTTIY